MQSNIIVTNETPMSPSFHPSFAFHLNGVEPTINTNYIDNFFSTFDEELEIDSNIDIGELISENYEDSVFPNYSPNSSFFHSPNSVKDDLVSETLVQEPLSDIDVVTVESNFNIEQAFCDPLPSENHFSCLKRKRQATKKYEQDSYFSQNSDEEEDDNDEDFYLENQYKKKSKKNKKKNQIDDYIEEDDSKKKREQNKRAAVKYRNKKRLEEEKNSIIYQNLLDKNQKLKRIVGEKSREVEMYRRMLKDLVNNNL